MHIELKDLKQDSNLNSAAIIDYKNIYSPSFNSEKFSISSAAVTAIEEGTNKEEEFTYQNPVQYWFLLIGYALGYGSFWRFPYLVYSSG